MKVWDRMTPEDIAEQLERRLLLLVAAALAIGLGLALAGWADQGPLVPAGLALLVGLPVINVALAAVSQARRGVWRFAAIAALTLALLCFSLLRFVGRL